MMKNHHPAKKKAQFRRVPIAGNPLNSHCTVLVGLRVGLTPSNAHNRQKCFGRVAWVPCPWGKMIIQTRPSMKVGGLIDLLQQEERFAVGMVPAEVA